MNKYPFLEAIGAADEKYLKEVFEDNEHERRRITMSKKKLVTIAAAAAAVIVLSVSVAAATAFTGLIGEDSAYGIAATYVVKHADSEEESDELGNFIIAGLTYDKSSEAQEVSFGLSGLRPVYNVKFKVGGYAYAVKVDAKTGTVLDVDRGIDENWDELYDELKAEADRKLAELEEQRALKNRPKAVAYSEAKDIFYDYFGLHYGILWENHSGDFFPIVSNNDENGCWDIVMTIDGYIYSASVDYDTGELSGTDVSEDPDYSGERYRYEPIEGIIRLREARKIAIEHLELTEDEYERNLCHADYYPAGILSYSYYSEISDIDIIRVDVISETRGKQYEVIFNAQTGELIHTLEWISIGKANEIATEASGIPADKVNHRSSTGNFEKYEVAVESDELGLAADVVVDSVTGEVLELNVYDITQKTGKPSADALKNQTLSLEAPDGMISEAVAAAIAFENSGVNEECVWALKVSLENGVYHISYWFGYDDFNETTSIGDYRTNTYEINAVTGDILSFDALTPEDYIGEETALAIALELAGIGEEDVDEVELKFENTMMGYPQYSIALFSNDGYIYRYNLDAVSGYDHIVR